MSRALLGAALAVALVAVAATPASAATLRSGSLEARVAESPFALAFVDRSDGDALETLPGSSRPDAYGPLGYSFDLRIPVVNNAYLGYYVAAEVKTLWFHATRMVRSRRAGRALVLELATNDPLGHRLELTLAPAADGVIRAHSRMVPGVGPLAGRASVSGAAFHAARGERYLGFGERSNAVDQTGNRVFSWAEEGPFSAGDYEDELKRLLPGYTFPTGPTTTNFPIPWLVSTRGLGFLIDQTQRSTFELTSERGDAWRAEAEAPEFDFTVFAGPHPAQVVRRYSAYAGRQPNPRAWLFGPWYQPTLEKQPLELARGFRKADVPVTVAQTYTHYLPCGAQRGKEQDERDRVRAYHRLGYRITTYFNPHVCLGYQPVYGDAARDGLLVRNRAGLPYILSNPFTADEQVSEIDFTAPGGRALFQRLLGQAVETGYDGWMEDFGEYTPTDSLFADGRGGLEMHNRYPVIYHRTSTELTTRRGGDFAVFIRSGFHGVQRYARVVWGGDPSEDWSCSDGLCAALHQLLAIGLSGVAYQGSDIGGFHAIASTQTKDELSIRWLELGAVSGVMRTQANGLSLRGGKALRSQVWSPGVLPVWRRYTKLRTQLYPYIAAASRTYQRTGLPLARQLSLVYPDDALLARSQREFMFGPDLLAAPVVDRGARTRALRLPPGNWIDLWRSTRYLPKSGSLGLRRVRRLRGPRSVTVPAPLEQLPLFVRAGAVLPLLPPDVDTLASDGQQKGLIHLSDRRRRLRLLALPRGRWSGALGTGMRGSSREGKRRWTLRLRAKRRYSIRLQASLGTLRRRFRPCHVTLGGKRVARRRWSYKRSTRVFRIRFPARRTRLTLRPCRG